MLCILYTMLFSQSLITPIPNYDTYKYNTQKAKLGQLLFNDKSLSANNSISCSSCHLLNDGGDDNIVHPIGINGSIISRNSPTVFNAVFNITQHWDGAFSNLQDQANSSITTNTAMGSNYKDIIKKLNNKNKYKDSFFKIYKEKITKENILDAIANFEKALITPNSKFDRYLNGEKNILNKNELNGYILFKDYGCISCHNGINIGGNLIQKVGIIKNYETDDFGRFYVTKNKNDKYYFKVPSLRNITLTAPYFHDGKIKTLQEAVKTMLIYQVGYSLEDKQIEDIVSFLKTLTGEKPKILKSNVDD